MGVELRITDRKFYTQFKNGSTFASNLSDFTTNLASGVMERTKVITQIDVNWFSLSFAGNGYTFDSATLTLTRKSGDWRDDGMSDGDSLDITYRNSGGTNIGPHDATVSIVDGQVMTFTGIPQIPGGATLANGTYSNMTIRGKSDLTALEYTFGLIENDENFNVISKVSGNDQGYYGIDIGLDSGGGRITTFIDLIPLGKYDDFITGSARIRYVNNPSTYVQRFIIEHDFVVNPWYVEGQLSNLNDNVIPDLLKGTKSLKQVTKFDFRTVLSNPNSSKIQENEDNLGSVAWFGENFNGYDNDYEIVSIDYEGVVTASSADGVLIDEDTLVTIDVNKISGAFPSGETAGIYVSYLPLENQYTNTLTTLIDNFIYDNAINDEGASVVTGDDYIYDYSSTLSGGNLIITFKIGYSTAQKTVIQNNEDANFLIAVVAGDNSVSNGNSDRVPLIAGVGAYDKSSDIPGLFEVTKLDFYRHDQAKGADTPSTDLYMWNEDGIFVDGGFSIDTDKDAFINTISLNVLAYNTVEDTFFLLDEYEFPINPNALSGTIQQLEVDTTRGFRLTDSDPFNKAFMTTDSFVFPDQFYRFEVGFKYPWQDWIANLSADDVFYDISKPNNNLNLKSSNYSELNNYEIRVGVKANVSGTGVLGNTGDTDYVVLSPETRVLDYDLDIVSPPVWSSVIETFTTSDGLTPDTSIGTRVLTGQDTFFRGTHTSIEGSVSDISDMWAIHRIEQTFQQGFNIYELSTDNPFPNGNWLKPLMGDSQLKMYIDSGTGQVITEGLVDSSFTPTGVGFNLSTRINDNVTPTAICFMFTTDSLTPDTFDAAVVKTGALADWTYGDGDTFNGNTSSHVYTLAGDKNGTVCFDNFDNVTELTFSDDGIVGTIDISALSKLSVIVFGDNPRLTTMVHPVTSTVVIQDYNVRNSNITGVLDMTAYTKLGGTFAAQGNVLMTGVTHTASTELISSYQVHLSGVTTLDVSDLNISGTFRADACPDLTSITTGSNSNTFVSFRVGGSDLASLDVSGYTGLGTNFRCENNNDLSTLSLPTSSISFTIFFTNNCDLTTLDISTLVIGGQFRCHSQTTGLTTLTTGSSTNSFTQFYFYSNSLTSVDLSGYTGLGGSLLGYDNDLTTLSLPITTKTFSVFDVSDNDLPYFDLTSMSNMFKINNGSYHLEDNGMTTGEVDSFLSDIASMVTGEGAGGDFTGRILLIDGSNAAPTGGTGNADYITIDGKGITLSIS